MYLTILFIILTSVTSPSAVHGRGNMFVDEEILGQLFLKLLLLCSPARDHKIVAVSERVSCARMIQTRRKSTRVVPHRCHGILTCNIEALCCVPRSIHGFCIPSLARVVFTWHLDHECKAVKMRSTDVAESQNFHCSKCRRLPVIHRLNMNLTLSSGGVGANVLLASSGVNSLSLLGSCATSRARMNGFAASPLFEKTHRVPMAVNPDLSK